MAVKQLTPIELQSKLQDKENLFLLDVREPFEFEFANIAGSTLIPLNQIPQRLNEVDYDSTVVTICHHGIRSLQAANFLEQVGFRNIFNLSGGIDRWSTDCDSSVSRY